MADARSRNRELTGGEAGARRRSGGRGGVDAESAGMPADFSSLRDAALPTPCLVADRSKVAANARRLRQRFAEAELVLRPHLKTVKSYDAALMAMASARGPATVSTLKEAEEFGRRGVEDLLYAVGVAPQKLARVIEIRRTGVDLKIIVDSEAAAQAVAAHADSTGGPIPTLIEIDVDGHRSGVPVGDEARLLAVGRALHAAGCLLGVMTHAGASYGESDEASLIAAAERERAGTVAMAAALRKAGLPCEVVSVGSTPTAFSVEDVAGITEVRAGVYLFFDLYQAGVGVCDVGDIALSVLATVIGHRESRGWIIVDAGWMALSADRSTASQEVDQYFGTVCDIDGKPYDDLVVLKTNQEHGIVAARPGSGAVAPDLPIGARLRILPNHACATAAQHADYKVVERGTDIVAIWPRFGGW